LGIIDTLTAGFHTTLRKPWLLVIPLLLDLFLEFGPKVSILPAYDRALNTLKESILATEDLAATDVGAVLDATELGFLRTAVEEYNLLSIVSPSRVLLPSIASIRPVDWEADRIIEISSSGQALGTAVLLIGLGLFAACIYWTLMAQEIRGRRASLSGMSRSIPLFWLRGLALVGLALVVLLGLTGVGVAVSFIAELFLLMGASFITQGILSLFVLGSWLAAVWAFVYLFFVPQAITMTEARPLTAVRQSFAIVRSRFWQSVGLVLLINIITAGLAYLWGMLMGSTGGRLVAIVANAFIGTGLLGATFIFFRDTVIAIHQVQQQRSHQ